MSLRTELSGLIALKKTMTRYEFRNDMDRIEAERKWMIEAIEVLLQAALQAQVSSTNRDAT